MKSTNSYVEDYLFSHQAADAFVSGSLVASEPSDWPQIGIAFLHFSKVFLITHFFSLPVSIIVALVIPIDITALKSYLKFVTVIKNFILAHCSELLMKISDNWISTLAWVIRKDLNTAKIMLLQLFALKFLRSFCNLIASNIFFTFSLLVNAISFFIRFFLP